MKKLFIVLITAILFTNFSCKKEGLTKETQIGANTFSCKIDGVIFKPSDKAGLLGSPPLTVYNLAGNGFTLLGKYYGDRTDPTSQYISINLPYLKNAGSYALNSFPSQGLYILSYSGGPAYQTDATHNGTVNITRCDTINQIYSGTFSFTAVDKNTNKVVKVTDGRFDVKK